MSWDPGQYLAFRAHRMRPALDLIARVPLEAPGTIVDLGCGAGNVTKALRARWPRARVTGIDASAEMLARARGDEPGIDWRMSDLRDWRPEAPVALIFSNAALHWIEGHETLFPRLVAAVAPGGVLAVQMPRNFTAPSHRFLYEAAREGPWRRRLEALLREEPTKSPAFYHDLLAPLAHEVCVWETEYLQLLEGENPVADYVKGSWLKPLLDALEEPDRSAFETAYRQRVVAAYPQRADGRTLFPFRRLFIVARL